MDLGGKEGLLPAALACSSAALRSGLLWRSSGRLWCCSCAALGCSEPALARLVLLWALWALWRCSVVLPWAALVLLCALGCSGAALGCSGIALGLPRPSQASLAASQAVAAAAAAGAQVRPKMAHGWLHVWTC